LLDELEAQGIADNTIIIYSSDHGLLNGEYGTGGKALLYDLVARIPLIIFDPRRPSATGERIDKRLVLSTDVPATILGLAGVAAPGSMQGKDLNAGSGDPGPDEIFLESLTVAEGNPFIEAIRTHDWKYVRYLAPQGCPYAEAHLDFSGVSPVFEQLFDLRHDPEERTNLVGMPQHQGELERFRQRISKLSGDLTRAGRSYKADMRVSERPAERQYCW